MESLIKATENYQTVAKKEEIDIDLFNEFMKKLSIWDYHCITREHYLSFSTNEKEDMIKKFYYQMKNRSSGKKFIFDFLFDLR